MKNNSPCPISAAAFASAGSHRLPYPHPHLLYWLLSPSASPPPPPQVGRPSRAIPDVRRQAPARQHRGGALSARTPPTPILHRRSTVRKTDLSWAPPSRHMAVRARGRPAVNAAHGLAGASSAGMINAFKLIQPMKDKYPGITYAELFQLASATTIEGVADPKIIPMTNGRVDVTMLAHVILLNTFGRYSYTMALDDKEIVALSGAHILGRPRPDRSGCGKPETKYVVCFCGLPASV
uniref:L-ascorbate peroxidase 8, chloroplastic n=1 Tax=Saccharum officinarum TaxID=4547 RepID=A0A678THV4_SACOF|nr:L-ascorbate peroxidase 8, chloroplastic [Saccharum officinarum]